MLDQCSTPRKSIRFNLRRAHGMRARYVAGCRCRLCGAANTEYLSRYYREHKDDIRQQHHDYYVRHRSEHGERSRRYRAEHADAVREAKRRAYEENRERYARYARRWYAKNRARVIAAAAEWNRLHPQEKLALARRRRARQLGNGGSHTAADIRAQYERQRGRCFYCREKVGKAFHVDHVLPIALGGSDGPENLVVACPSCNRHKSAMHPMDWAGVLL